MIGHQKIQFGFRMCSRGIKIPLLLFLIATQINTTFAAQAINSDEEDVIVEYTTTLQGPISQKNKLKVTYYPSKDNHKNSLTQTLEKTEQNILYTVIKINEKLIALDEIPKNKSNNKTNKAKKEITNLLYEFNRLNIERFTKITNNKNTVNQFHVINKSYTSKLFPKIFSNNKFLLKVTANQAKIIVSFMYNNLDMIYIKAGVFYTPDMCEITFLSYLRFGSNNILNVSIKELRKNVQKLEGFDWFHQLAIIITYYAHIFEQHEQYPSHALSNLNTWIYEFKETNKSVANKSKKKNKNLLPKFNQDEEEQKEPANYNKYQNQLKSKSLLLAPPKNQIEKDKKETEKLEAEISQALNNSAKEQQHNLNEINTLNKNQERINENAKELSSSATKMKNTHKNRDYGFFAKGFMYLGDAVSAVASKVGNVVGTAFSKAKSITSNTTKAVKIVGGVYTVYDKKTHGNYFISRKRIINIGQQSYRLGCQFFNREEQYSIGRFNRYDTQPEVNYSSYFKDLLLVGRDLYFWGTIIHTVSKLSMYYYRKISDKKNREDLSNLISKSKTASAAAAVTKVLTGSGVASAIVGLGAAAGATAAEKAAKSAQSALHAQVLQSTKKGKKMLNDFKDGEFVYKEMSDKSTIEKTKILKQVYKKLKTNETFAEAINELENNDHIKDLDDALQNIEFVAYDKNNKLSEKQKINNSVKSIEMIKHAFWHGPKDSYENKVERFKAIELDDNNGADPKEPLGWKRSIWLRSFNLRDYSTKGAGGIVHTVGGIIGAIVTFALLCYMYKWYKKTNPNATMDDMLFGIIFILPIIIYNSYVKIQTYIDPKYGQEKPNSSEEVKKSIIEAAKKNGTNWPLIGFILFIILLLITFVIGGDDKKSSRRKRTKTKRKKRRK